MVVSHSRNTYKKLNTTKHKTVIKIFLRLAIFLTLAHIFLLGTCLQYNLLCKKNEIWENFRFNLNFNYWTIRHLRHKTSHTTKSIKDKNGILLSNK